MNNFLSKKFMTPLLCFLAGSLCALGMAPYNIWAVFLFGFGVLYWAVDKAASKRLAFSYGWLWAFGYFVFSLYWIGNALLVEGNPYKWAWPLAVCGLPAVLAMFNACACVIAHRYLDLKRWIGYLGFAALLSLFEYLRGHLFTGFPWNLYGYSWASFPQVAQLASLGSVYFLTFMTLLWLSIAGFSVVTHECLKKRILIGVLSILFIGSVYYGDSVIPQRTALRGDVAVKIVQPNTDQAEKWQRDKMDGHFTAAIELSMADQDDKGQKTIIIWPETTISPSFLESDWYMSMIADMLKSYQGEAVLMTGALRYQKDDKTYHNSLLTIDQNGVIDDVYDKSHLVPFGEYIPFQDYIPLAPITQFQGFARGGGPTTLKIFDDLKFSPLICYEILFPDKAINPSEPPDFIVNLTNDAWYGDSAGPRQHLVKAQFRAIEERIPVLRAANTGVSAIITPYGRVALSTNTFTQESLFMKLPKNVNKPFENIYVFYLLFPLLPLSILLLAVANKIRGA